MARDTAARASAPGSVILFGEHALEFGEPAVALAVDIRASCGARVSDRFTVNDEELDQKRHAYIRGAVLNGWSDMDTPIAVTPETDIPPELGLGGQGAGTVACLGAISMLHNHIIFEYAAKNAFHTHCEVDGRCVPLDTATSTHGGGVMLDTGAGENQLWAFKDRNRTWHAHDIELPEMELVLGYTGTPSPAREMRNKISRFHQRNSFARDIIKDIGATAREGHAALLDGDLEGIGRSMTGNHRLLVNLGVGTPALEKLVRAASRHSYGAKITGPGGGGCIIALARDAERVSEAIESSGGKAFGLTIASEGLRPED